MRSTYWRARSRQKLPSLSIRSLQTVRANGSEQERYGTQFDWSAQLSAFAVIRLIASPLASVYTTRSSAHCATACSFALR